MEINFLNRKKGLELKIPEINKTLSVVEFLISKQVNAIIKYPACFISILNNLYLFYFLCYIGFR